ncbi:MAG: hypothetical protein WD512_03130 [Candidatus Paceibacterota bacterium]
MTRICIFAKNEKEADRWAENQNLSKSQYFYPKDLNDVMFRTNFHVIVIGIQELSVNAQYFEKIYALAQQRGKIGRE